MRLLLTLGFLFSFILTCFSQSIITIQGEVIDAVSFQPVELANILVKNTATGTVTDSSGKFILQIPDKYDTLIITYVGYENFILILNNDGIQYYKILLVNSAYNLNELIIRPKEDPGKALMKKVIDHKKQNNHDHIETYKARGYTKIEVDIGNLDLTDTVKENGKAKKQFKVLKDYIDTSEDQTGFLPFFFTETVSDYYYRRNPKTKKEVILASRTSGINNASATQVLGNYYEHFNIYDDFWYLISKNFVPPLTDAWNFYYRVELTDSSFIDDDWCFRIEFEPRQKQENTFTGFMWIADSSYAVKEVYMELDSTANINYYRRAIFYQKFDNQNDSVWVQVKDQLLVEFLPVKSAVSFIAKKTSIYTDYTLSMNVFDEVVKYKDDIVYSDTVINNDEAYWSTVRPEQLNTNETGVYFMVDSLKQIPAFNTIVEVYNTLMYGYWDLGYVRIGPLANIVSQDDVEGLRVRLGGKTGDLISQRFSVGGYLAYGFSDREYKYGSEFSYIISKKPWQQFRFNYENDLDVNSSDAVTFGEDNILSGFYRRRDTPQKIIDHVKYKWYYEKEWIWGISNSLTLTSNDMHPLFDIYYANENDSIVKDINNAELKLGIRFAYREKFLFDNYRRYSLGTKYPILKINYAVGIKGFIESDFNYQSLELICYDDFPVRSFGVLDFRISLGKIFGTLPSLLLHSPAGNETYFFTDHSFNLMNEYEFMTDSYAEVFLTHNFYGFFLNKLPLVRRLKLREVASFKLVYGTLSNSNEVINDYSKNIPPYFISNSAPFPKPYMEAGVGVENILKLIRLDAYWRLTYRNNQLAPNFGVRLGVSLDI